MSFWERTRRITTMSTSSSNSGHFLMGTQPLLSPMTPGSENCLSLKMADKYELMLGQCPQAPDHLTLISLDCIRWIVSVGPSLVAHMVKILPTSPGDLGLIPGSGWPHGGGHDNPLQYSCLENPHGQRSLAGYSPWGCKKSHMTEWLSTAQHWLRMFH